VFSLENKIALVIGGKGKIGLEISYGLAKQGAKVYVASRNVKVSKDVHKKFNDLGIKILKLDASIETEVNVAVNNIIENVGNIDILVNSSAWRPQKNFIDDSIENWENSIKVNSNAIFIPSRVIGRKMAQNKSGSIINISSIYGITAPPMSIYQDCDFETEPDYPFLKSGCIGLSKYLSSYFAEDNVRVNVVAPGGIFNNQPEGFTNRYNAMVPMRRMASAKDIVGAVIFLASDESSYVTGVVIPVDGGWTAV
jgi:NAD(P)-dependent dehydrogenase (short-subunit alcohol dehydrogenase family)